MNDLSATAEGKRSSTAFVLAGGGSLGAVQVGMLKALSRQGIVADFVVGASAGAINGAYYAADPDEAGVARLERIWRGLHRSDIFPLSLAGSLSWLLGWRDYLATPAPLQSLIESELPYRQLEQARLPCHVVATDVLDGTEVLFSSGDVVPALLASTAIPVIFPTVSIGERHLIDGGVAGNTPISTALHLGATRVIVLPTGMSCALEKPPRGSFAIAVHALNLLAMRQLRSDVERYSERCELIVIPSLCPLAVHAYDFSHTGELIDRAEAATRLWLRGGLNNRDSLTTLLPHRHRAA